MKNVVIEVRWKYEKEHLILHCPNPSWYWFRWIIWEYNAPFINSLHCVSWIACNEFLNSSRFQNKQRQAGLFHVFQCVNSCFISYSNKRREQNRFIGHDQNTSKSNPLKNYSFSRAIAWSLNPIIEFSSWDKSSWYKKVCKSIIIILSYRLPTSEWKTFIDVVWACAAMHERPKFLSKNQYKELGKSTTNYKQPTV